MSSEKKSYASIAGTQRTTPIVDSIPYKRATKYESEFTASFPAPYKRSKSMGTLVTEGTQARSTSVGGTVTLGAITVTSETRTQRKHIHYKNDGTILTPSHTPTDGARKSGSTWSDSSRKKWNP